MCIYITNLLPILKTSVILHVNVINYTKYYITVCYVYIMFEKWIN